MNLWGHYSTRAGEEAGKDGRMAVHSSGTEHRGTLPRIAEGQTLRSCSSLRTLRQILTVVAGNQKGSDQ